MKAEENFLLYGTCDVSEIQRLIIENNLSWTDYTDRQNYCTDMKDTQTIPIVFDRGFFTTSFIPVYDENYTIFENEILKISEIIKSHTNGEGYLLRALLVKLLAGKSIPRHIDIINKTFQYSRRIHIPIITNPDCIFTVGDESINMKVGEIWEMNNDKKPHSVHNNGTEDRVHLIIDWCEKPLENTNI